MTYVEDYVKRLDQIRALSVAGMQIPEPASKSDIANLILQRARMDAPVTAPPSVAKKQEGSGGVKGFALGILDKLSRPLYAAAGAADVAFNEEDNDPGKILEGAKRGFTGKDHKSFVDVLQHQYRNDVLDDPEYKRILEEYGPDEAAWYKQMKEREADKSLKAIIGGTIADIGLDPINAVGAGLIGKPIKALRELSSTDKALEGIEATGREAATSGVTEAVQDLGVTPEEAQAASNLKFNDNTKKWEDASNPRVFEQGSGHGISQDLLDQLRAAKTTEQEMPRATGKFASNRRPPQKTFDATSINSDTGLPKLGNEVKAMFGQEAKDFTEQLRQTPKFANLSDVFNRNLREKDFEGLQKARVLDETAAVTDQVAKGNPAAVDLITRKTVKPLNPVARRLTDTAVQHTVREITESIADPAKARAAGRQPRHPVLNAPSQSNLSQKITNAARRAFTADTGQKVTKAAAPKFIPAVYERYINMLKNAEESLITRSRSEANDAFYPRGGIKPDSPYLRLSDVLEALPRELAQKIILGPRQQDKVLPSVLLKAITGNKTALGKIAGNKELLQAVQNTDWAPLMVKEHATRTIDAANAAHSVTNDVASFVNAKLAGNSSDVEKAAAIDDAISQGNKAFRKEMPAAKASVKDILGGLRQNVNPIPSIPDAIIERGKNKLAASVFDASKATDAQAPRIETAAAHIEEATDGVPAKQAGLRSDLADAAGDNLFGTVLSWIKPNAGYKDLRPVLLKNISVRKSSAATRAHEIIKIFQMVPQSEHLAFWNEVRGFIPPVAEHANAVELMQKMIGNMFGESGLAEKFAGRTSIARAGINVDHLNKHLRIVGIKDFRFERDIPDPLDPKKKIRLDPEQVLDTWKSYAPKDSQDLRVFTHNLTQAVENAMVEYSTFANIGALFSKAGSDTMVVSGMHPAIDGMSFPRELAPQMGKLARGIDEMFESVSNSKLMRAYDQALRTWKTGVTIYAPSHHIRNMIGDVFMGWMDGLSNPVYYSKAASLLKANAHRYSDISTGKSPLANILGEGRETELIGQIIGQTNTRLPKGTRVIAKARVGNKTYPITIDQAYQMAYRHGIFPHAAQIEDLPGTETLMESLANKFHPDKAGPFAPAKGKVAKGVRQVSETREHYVRAAHWLYALENTKANSLEELFQKAGDRVRKYHPDGLDLTPTEKKVFRRIIPFYSWTRKAIPLVLEGLVMHPSKITMYPKIMANVQESQGIDSSVSDPWPDDQLFPDWLSSNVIGPTIPWDSSFAKTIARSDDEVGYGIVNPGMPSTDILEDYFNNPVKGIANSVTPFLKIPAEIATGHQVQSGAPIDDKTEYVDKNVPMLSTLSRLTNGALGTGLVEGGDLKGKETSAGNLPALINFLTGAGILDTGRYEKSAEFDLKRRLAEERKNASK